MGEVVLPVTASVGVVLFAGGMANAEQFLKDADNAMYEAAREYQSLWRRPTLDANYGEQAMAAFQSMLASPDYRSRRLAFVTGSTLARGQLLRAATGRYVRCFDDAATAEAWLFEENQAAKDEPRRRANG